jgi:ArsR family transcriptional regulator, virulence genes transcriptional regulator
MLTAEKRSKSSDMAIFAAKAAEAVSLLKELASEKRLLVLCALMDRREMSVTELAERVALGQSALSQHLARLREQNIVTYRRDGATLLYSVSDRNISRILKTLKSIYC